MMAGLEIIEQTPAPINHLQQASAGGMILFMALEVGHELGDAFAQDSHLDLRRTGILGMDAILLDYRSLLSTYQGHSVCYPFFAMAYLSKVTQKISCCKAVTSNLHEEFVA